MVVSKVVLVESSILAKWTVILVKKRWMVELVSAFLVVRFAV